MGYISEGESTIDIQSQQAATLHMITIRVILPQFTMIWRPAAFYTNQEKKFICENETFSSGISTAL